MVKRSLPRSGAYDLERLIIGIDTCLIIVDVFKNGFLSRYLPVFLWKERMKRHGLDPLNELLKLVAGRQNNDVDDVEEVRFLI